MIFLQFDQYATTVVESANFNAKAIAESYDSFADHITTYSTQTGATWPCFTFPDIEIHGKNLLEQTLSVGFFISHFVQREEKGKWENYTAETGNPYDKQFAPIIHRYTDDRELDPVNIGEAPWGPVWEIYPEPLWPLMNYNIYPDQPVTKIVKELKEATYGAIVVEETLAPVFGVDVSQGQPSSAYYVPVFDDFRKTNVVGIISGFLVWGDFIQNLLPTGVDGINVILDSGKCGLQFTWRLDGPKAVFLGAGDLHEAEYDDYAFSTIFGKDEESQAFYDAGICTLTIRVYPSDEFKNDFSTRRPVILSALVGGVFILVVVSFFAFDFFQTRRNRIVLASAAKTSSLVTSLFPAAFRDRLLQDSESEEQKQNGKRKKSKKTFYASHNDRIRKYLDGSTGDGDDVSATFQSKPLAEFYPDVTVM